jgi:beta-hydroxylase
MTAASSPNETGDQTGGLNSFWLCLSNSFKSQSFKRKNRQLYYFLNGF